MNACPRVLPSKTIAAVPVNSVPPKISELLVLGLKELVARKKFSLSEIDRFIKGRTRDEKFASPPLEDVLSGRSAPEYCHFLLICTALEENFEDFVARLRLNADQSRELWVWIMQ